MAQWILAAIFVIAMVLSAGSATDAERQPGAPRSPAKPTARRISNDSPGAQVVLGKSSTLAPRSRSTMRPVHQVLGGSTSSSTATPMTRRTLPGQFKGMASTTPPSPRLVLVFGRSEKSIPDNGTAPYSVFVYGEPEELNNDRHFTVPEEPSKDLLPPLEDARHEYSGHSQVAYQSSHSRSPGYTYPEPQWENPAPSQGYDDGKPQQNDPVPSQGYSYPRPQQDEVKPDHGYSYPRPQQGSPTATQGYTYHRPQQEDSNTPKGHDGAEEVYNYIPPAEPNPQNDVSWKPMNVHSPPPQSQSDPDSDYLPPKQQLPLQDEPLGLYRPVKTTPQPVRDELSTKPSKVYVPPPQNEEVVPSYLPPTAAKPEDDLPYSYLTPSGYVPPPKATNPPLRDEPPSGAYGPPVRPSKPPVLDEPPSNAYVPPSKTTQPPLRDEPPSSGYIPAAKPTNPPLRDEPPSATYLPPSQSTAPPQQDSFINRYVPDLGGLRPMMDEATEPTRKYIPVQRPQDDSVPTTHPGTAWTDQPTANDWDEGGSASGKSAKPRHLATRSGHPDENGMRVTDMSCLRTAARSRFTATITSASFVSWPPSLDGTSVTAGSAVLPPGCRVIADPGDPHHRFLVDLTNPDLTRCGVKGCSADGEPRLCLRLVLPTLPGLRLAGDPVIVLQCALQPAIGSLVQQVRVGAAQAPSARSSWGVHAGGERAHLHAQLQLFRRGVSGEFSRQLASGGAAHLGDELQLRAVVRRGDGWQSSRLADVVVRRVGASVSGDAVHLLAADGCNNPDMKPVCPRGQGWLPGDPLVSLLPMRVFMFRGMQDGDQLLVSARVVACLDRKDCKVESRSCEERSGRAGRSRRATDNTTAVHEESVLFRVEVPSRHDASIPGRHGALDAVPRLPQHWLLVSLVVIASMISAAILGCGCRARRGDQQLPFPSSFLRASSVSVI